MDTESESACMPTDRMMSGRGATTAGGAGPVHAERARWFVAFGGVQFTVSVCTDREARDDVGESTLWVSACDAARVPTAVDEAVLGGYEKGLDRFVLIGG